MGNHSELGGDHIPPVIAILGPTCAWKSQVAIYVALELGGEIISCDAMQIYRQLSVGTAKPSVQDLATVPHHLVNLLDITDKADANWFVGQAEIVLAKLKHRKIPGIVAGGTGLYAKALLYTLELLPSSPEVYDRVAADYASPGGRICLLRELEDDEGRVPHDVLSNHRRLLRAVEVKRITGMSPWRHHKSKPTVRLGIKQFVIRPDMPLLRARIEERARIMLEDGWIEETENLAAKGLFNTPTARQALGYKEIFSYLCGEIHSLDELYSVLVTRTVQYARRQRTWFRGQHPEATVLVASVGTTAPELANQILGYIGYANPVR